MIVIDLHHPNSWKRSSSRDGQSNVTCGTSSSANLPLLACRLLASRKSATPNSPPHTRDTQMQAFRQIMQAKAKRSKRPRGSVQANLCRWRRVCQVRLAEFDGLRRGTSQSPARYEHPVTRGVGYRSRGCGVVPARADKGILWLCCLTLRIFSFTHLFRVLAYRSLVL